jgi:polar amino acid transport system permease protein
MPIALDFAAVLQEWPILLKGMTWTLGLTTVSALLGLILGIAAAWMRTECVGWGRILVATYVELIRNTPFIVQLFFIFFGLPALGVKLSSEWASVIAMVINLGAYSAEIVRAGIQATPRGQVEAALSLAMTHIQIFTRVVLPPALKRVWPALVSQIIIVMLGSAVCGQIATEELSFAANLIQSRNFRAFEAFIVATGLYLVLSVTVRDVLNRVGRRYLFGGHRG